MNELETLDLELSDTQTSGALALGRYASLCLRYADAVERLCGEKRWRFMSEGVGYSSNEYLLARIVDELSGKGLVAETLSVLGLIRRPEFANAVRSRTLPQLADTDSSGQFRDQLQALSTDKMHDLLTAAEVCGKLREYADGLKWLDRALDKLQGASGLEIGWWTWDRLARILDSYPPNDATLAMVLRAREVVLAAQNYGPGSHRIIGLLAKFEAQTPLAREILDALPSTPVRGADISPADMANRTRAERWAERGNWAKALEVANRVENLEYRVYTLDDLARVLYRKGCSESLAQIADSIEHLGMKTGDYQRRCAAKALLHIGEWKRGLCLLWAQESNYWSRVLDWVNYAEELLELGETQAANELLDAALESVKQLPRDRRQQAYGALAVGMAKAGRFDDVLIVTNLLKEKSRGLVLADISQYARRSDHHNQALALVEEAKVIAEREKVPKARASQQHHILKNLLAIDEFQSAWEVLGLLVDTLEQTPAFSKHEFRAGDVAETLLPYVGVYPKVIYHFVTDLLRRDARHSYWQTVHGISATLPLMLATAGCEPLLDLAAFLADWPAGEQGD